ncbi:fasciclin domain-containing protein [Niabella hibiscisoli]|uniref:fasciclin domain-containing protein n=1 Tax=Niabella hibiscisoli TaxID=1825928 RepID=UPI001F0FB7A1|nr:fasciclin domain-containing protein [Niabella hibiscisoli]MCH5718357.1 fasciclin domain-containing protein [Niabella hibiscisoli]
MKKFAYLLIVMLAAASSLFLSSCQKAQLQEATSNDPNILQYLQNDSLSRFTKLVTLIDKAGYTTAFNTYGTYTFFAPTNEAIDKYMREKTLPLLNLLQKNNCRMF